MIQSALFADEVPASELSEAREGRQAGVVYTKRWVVDLILDLVGYRAPNPIWTGRIVEPAAGDGAFLIPIAERLVQACRANSIAIRDCADCVRAFEVDSRSAAVAKANLLSKFEELGCEPDDARALVDVWVVIGDYLHQSIDAIGGADWVVGNPPYIRLEDLERGGQAYRSAYPTMVGRSDIYVAFYEASVRHLRPGGALGFICADRWMFNRYGAALRRFVANSASVEIVLQMHDADAFESDVSAYPAISIIRRSTQGPVVVGELAPCAASVADAVIADEVLRVLRHGGASSIAGVSISRADRWFSGSDPWTLVAPRKHDVLRQLESQFPTLEETGASVGIGVATGADRVFVTKDPSFVEQDRLLALAMAGDLKSGELRWSGHYLVNPWNHEGLVDLARYPRLAAHFERYRKDLVARHVGRKNGDRWYRTIDRVNHALTAMPKLYIPDIKGRIAPVLDNGETYPHHNLYFVLPGPWDLEVLGGLLLSQIAQFFVEAYGVKMRGGYLRFQAQYLRRIRVPNPNSLAPDVAESLRLAFAARDGAAATRAAAQAYGLTVEEVAQLGH